MLHTPGEEGLQPSDDRVHRPGRESAGKVTDPRLDVFTADRSDRMVTPHRFDVSLPDPLIISTG
ncbi:hypothetical protein QP312_09045, partial [Pauljensenia sp. UMB8040A]|uniref:hypothetical protein n=1 Tax=Pauljensenia sp. UMB8040A TaxID=3046343 RepID=UPI002550330E